MIENKINDLIKDVKDEFWRNKIKRSIDAILRLYKLSLDDISISRQEIDPKEIYVVSTEECDLDTAKKLKEEKYSDVPPPITIIQQKGKNVLFMGSNRSLVFILHKKNPDCIVVEISDNIESKIISEAKVTLEELSK